MLLYNHGVDIIDNFIQTCTASMNSLIASFLKTLWMIFFSKPKRNNSKWVTKQPWSSTVSLCSVLIKQTIFCSDLWRFLQKEKLSREHFRRVLEDVNRNGNKSVIYLLLNSCLLRKPEILSGRIFWKLHVVVPPSVSFAFRVWDKGSKKACKGWALWPFLFSANPHPPLSYEGQGTVHWKVAPCPHPHSFCPCLSPYDHEILHQPAASCLINILSSQELLPPPDHSGESWSGDGFNWQSRVPFCFWCILIPYCVFVCRYLQGGGGIHGATLQAPAIWRQEASVWRQEEHLHGASTSYWEWEGRCLQWFCVTLLHHAIITIQCLLRDE